MLAVITINAIIHLLAPENTRFDWRNPVLAQYLQMPELRAELPFISKDRINSALTLRSAGLVPSV